MRLILSSICHYSFPWTNGAWALERVETKSMKGTISYFSTRHDGILKQCIRCGVHHSAIAFQFHSFRILEEKLWKHDSIPLVVVQSPNQKSLFMANSKWMDLKALHDVFASNIALVMTCNDKKLMSTEHNKSELDTSLSTQKHVSYFHCPYHDHVVKYVVLVVNIV